MGDETVELTDQQKAEGFVANLGFILELAFVAAASFLGARNFVKADMAAGFAESLIAYMGKLIDPVKLREMPLDLSTYAGAVEAYKNDRAAGLR